GDGVQLRQRLRDLLIERRHYAIQHLREIEQDLLALVADSEPLARMLRRLPARRDLDANAAPDVAHVLRRQRRIEPVQKMLGNPLLLAQQRAPGRLAGVRCKHRLDAHAGEQLEQLLQSQSAGLECGERVLDATGLRTLSVAQEVLSAPPDAM